MTTTRLLGNASTVTPEFTFSGVTYQLSHPDQASIARYESLLIAREVQAVKEAASLGLLSDDERRAELIAIAGKSAAGEQAAGGSLFLKYHSASHQQEGIVLYALSMLMVPGSKGYQHATIEHYQVASKMLRDPEILVAFSEVLPPFLSLLLSGVQGMTPERLEAVTCQLQVQLAMVRDSLMTKSDEPSN